MRAVVWFPAQIQEVRMRDPLRPIAIVYRAEEDEIALAAQVNEDFEAGFREIGQGEARCLEAGRKLCQIQEMRQEAGHGHDWEKWVKDNIRANLRTVRDWMKRFRDSRGGITADSAVMPPDGSTNQGAARADALQEQNGEAAQPEPASAVEA